MSGGHGAGVVCDREVVVMITAREAMVQRRVLDAMAVANKRGSVVIYPHQCWADVEPEDRAALDALIGNKVESFYVKGRAVGWVPLEPRAIAAQRSRITSEVRAAVMERQARREVEQALRMLGWSLGTPFPGQLEEQTAVGMTVQLEHWAVVAASAPWWDRGAALLLLEAGHLHRGRAFGEGVAAAQRGWLLDRIEATLRKRPS